MKSPFPGMDPYLEPHWPGLHAHLASLATAKLNQLMPEDLAAEPDERLAIEDYADIGRRARDVPVWQLGELDISEGGAAASAPYELVVDIEPTTKRFIRIIRADNGRLVTVIEFISPTNKIGEGLEQYCQKRDELLAAGVHVVEIDLVRRGNWRALLRPHLCPFEAIAAYRVTVRIGGGRTAYLYPAPLRQRLPVTSIPLRPGDKAARLDLQPLLDQAYENGRYGRTLDYTQPADPPLEAEDAAWAQTLVQKRT
jgi:hypothetical protein